MKNRIASLFLAFALLMSLCTFAVARDNPIAVQSGGAERFTDVPASHWAYSYIDQVVGSGLFNGKTPTTFEPSSAMTRSQFVMVMARMEGMSSLEGQYTQTKFPDVTPTRRAAGPIAWASADEQGFVRGFGDGTFKPDSPITRGQFAALIHRYIVAKRYTNLHVVDPEPAQFTDASSVSPAFTEDVEYARVHGLLTGYSDGTVRASNPITRAAIAAILARFLDLVNESGYIPLMDGPVPGDTGNSETPPVETPTEYKDIKLTVKNGTHGTTSITSVTRDGKQVTDPDALQQGDVVTVYHKPDSGYVASIRVKDSKNKTVKPVTTKGDYSTFTLPKNLPVTITVTYTKASSGGGGGGGGGSSGGGGDYDETAYYMTATAVFDPAAGGKAYVTQQKPTDGGVLDMSHASSDTFSRIGNKSVYVYTVFVPNDPNATCTGIDKTENVTDITQPETFTMYPTKNDQTNKTNGFKVTYVRATATGNSSRNKAPDIIVTAHFGSGQPSTDAKTWKLEAAGEGAYFQFYKDPNGLPTAALTASGTTPFTFGEVTTDSANAYLAITPKAGYKFANAPTADNADIILEKDVSDTLRVYKLTKSNFAKGVNTTKVSVTLFKDEALTYKVDVKIQDKDGNALSENAGTVSLNINGEIKKFAKSETYTLDAPKMKSDYLKLYPNRTDYKLPVYLTGTPVAGEGYKFVSVTGADEDDNSDHFDLQSGQTLTVTAVFEKIADSYGYNLTIIGQGTVTGTFNGKTVTHTNSNSEPQTFSSGLVIGANKSMTLTNATPNAKAGFDKAESPIVADLSKSYGSAFDLTANKLTEIVVEFYNSNRSGYKFTVKLVNNSGKSVTVKSENGKLGTGYDAGSKQLQGQLFGPQTITTDTEYWAYGNSVITITPATDATTKVKSIEVKTGTTVQTDVMATPGFSFQVLPGTTTATVTFGTVNSYDLLVRSPYGANVALSSESTFKSASFGNVLNSLNDGQKSTKSNSNGIENEFYTTPDKFNQVVYYYLNNEVATPKAGSSITKAKITGSEYLQDMMSESVSNNISSMVDSLIKGEVSKLQANSATITAPITTSMTTEQQTRDNAQPVAATGDVKQAIIDAVLASNATLKAKYDAGAITAANFNINIKATPILSTAKEAAYPALSLTGKSVESQIKSFVIDYLSKVQVGTYDYTQLQPNVQVSPVKNDSQIPTLSISAGVTTTGTWPQLDNSKKMADYADKLEVYFVVEVTSISAGDQTVTNLPAPALYSSSQLGSNNEVKTTVQAELTKADTTIQNTWNTTLTTMVSSIPMDKVLTEETFGKIVDDMIDSPLNTLTSKVNGIGDASASKSAFKNLYNDFVVFNSADTTKFLTLKTKGGEAPVIGKIEDNKLVLTLNFETILRDKATPTDNGAFEQLIDLLLAFRNGISEDIRATSEKSGNNQTSQTVIASMIQGQLNSKRGNSLNVTKWGTTKTGGTSGNMTALEKKEVANLLAELLMNAKTSQSMDEVYANFEANGYTLVSYSIGFDASKRASFAPFAESLNSVLGSGNEVNVGFKLERKVN